MTRMTMNDMNDTNNMKDMKGMKKNFIHGMAIVASIVMSVVVQVSAQSTSTQGTAAPPQTASTAKQNGKPVLPPPVLIVPPDYRIGLGDVLVVNVWREDSASGEVMVRPDGKVTPKMLDDIMALGLTTDELKKLVEEGLKKFFAEGVPPVQVVVKAINSRKVFVTGNVGKPGVYMLSAPTTVLQMIATAGGLLEYAKAKDIRIMRTETGKTVSLKFNYKDVSQGKKLEQNILLKPGDTLIIP